MSDCQGCTGCPAHTAVNSPESQGSKAHICAVVGPPNAGKSTLFNQLTGMRQKVANFPGVTVEQRVGKARLDGAGEVMLVDLPGVYSLQPRSEDERVTRDVLFGKMKDVPRPDSVLLILDSTNLGRHLVLAAPILDLGLPTLVVLNMADDLRARGGEIHTEDLSRQLGAPVVLVSAASGENVEAVIDFLKQRPPAPAPVELPVLHDVPKCRAWAATIGNRSSYQPPAPPIWTRRLDSLFLHPIAGPLVFLMVVVAVFQTMFSGARPLMNGLQTAINASGAWVGSFLPVGVWRSLLIEGGWAGAGAVVVFLPQILLLFLFIGILEDSGYLARAALIADRTMARVGLQGKSFIPLLSAYACAVPAILSARTIENRRDRIATILIAPFMTCSARLPVYTLIIAAFIPDRPLLGPFLGSQAAAMLGLYVIGFAAAFTTARILKSSVLKTDRQPFVLEMPAYRRPTLQSISLRLLDRAKVFLRRAGTVILPVTLVLWCLAHLPLDHGKMPAIEESVAGTMGRMIEPVLKPLGFNWKIGVGLITSLAAREVIVGTLGTIYGIEGDARSQSLQQALHRDLAPAGAIALLIFFAFAMQCTSTIAVVRKETGGWKWPAFQFCYMGVLAYAGALIANQVVSRILV